MGITTVSASESLKGSKTFPATARQFEARIDALGWRDIDRVRGPAVQSLTYIGMAVVVSDTFETKVDALWTVMFPSIDRELPSGLMEAELQSGKYSKWRNAWCDVHTLWAHINAGRDVFVTTNTRDFHKNADKLEKLGVKDIRTPAEALRSLAD